MDSACSEVLRLAGLPYPRTCVVHGLSSCTPGAENATKMIDPAEMMKIILDNSCANAREGAYLQYTIELHCTMIKIVARRTGPRDDDPYEILSYEIQD